jgi:hypothetical protein
MIINKSITIETSSETNTASDGFTEVGVNSSNVGYSADDVGNNIQFIHKYKTMLPHHCWYDTHFQHPTQIYDKFAILTYSSGTVVVDTTNLTYDGAWWLKSSTSAGSGATIYVECPIRIQKSFRLTAYLYAHPQAGVVTNMVGFCDTLDITATPTAGMYFKYDSGSIYAYCRNSEGETTAKVCDISTDFTGLYEIILDSSRTSVMFKLTDANGTVLGQPTITTNIPSVSEPVYAMASSRKSTTGVAFNMLIDYIGFGHQYGWERRFTA